MSQNPWKKQAQVNKTQNPPAGSGGGGNPPWKKPQSGATGAPPTTQPPGFKPPQAGQPPPFANKPAGGPPVANNTPPLNNGAPGTSPWMKNNTPSQPNTFKPGGNTPPPTGGTGPQWMKNKQATSPAATQRKQQQKQKQQEERMQKEKKMKQQQLKRQAQQIKKMQYEQQYSKIRQTQDKVKQSQKKNSKNVKKASPKKAPVNQTSKTRKNLNAMATPFHRYITSFSLICSKDEQYRSKLQYQQQFVQNMYKFSQSAKQGIIEYLKDRKIAQRKKNVINLQNIVIQYAIVEGVSGQPGSAYFKTKNIQNLQQKYLYYQTLFHVILKLIKKTPSFRIRIPLLARISFKGIQFLCEAVCDQLLDSIPSPAENFIEMHGELAQFQKQLKQIGYQFLNRKCFQVKKISINNSEFYVLYLSQINGITTENAMKNRVNLYPNSSPSFDTLINLSLVASRKLSLSYIFMREFNQIKKNATQRFKQTYLNLFQVAHAIRIVYASCQGELEQQSFWSLIFEQNNQIWSMVRKSYQSIYGEVKNQNQCKLRNKFMLAKIIQLMIPVSFGVGKQKINDASQTIKQTNQGYVIKKVPISLNPTVVFVSCYPLQSLQFYEISQLFDKNIENPGKIKVAQDSCQLQQNIIKCSQQIYLKKINYFINKTNLLFKKGMNTKNKQLIYKSITMAENYQFQKGKQMQKVIIYPLLMTFYMAGSQIKFSKNANQKQSNQEKQEKQVKEEKKEKNEQQDNKNKENLVQSEVKQFQTDQKIKGTQKQNQDKDDLQQREKKQGDSQKQQEQEEDNQTKMLSIFGKLLYYLSQLFENEQQIWVHADIYMILASYYSKPKQKNTQSQVQVKKIVEQQQKNNIYFNKSSTLKNKVYSNSQINNNQSQISKRQAISQSMVEPQDHRGEQIEKENLHPYKKQCMKFIELSHKICLQYYGTHSIYMAQFLFHEAEIYYNIHQYNKAQNSIQQSLKIYKSSSKHAKNILNCSIVLGKSLIQRAKIENDNKTLDKGIQILQKVAQEMFILGFDLSVVEVYQFLCANIQYSMKVGKTGHKADIQNLMDNSKNSKVQAYLQKIAEISLNNKNIQFVKNIMKKIIKSQIVFYSKQRAIVLKDLHESYVKNNVPDQQDEEDYILRIEDNLNFLQEQKHNFGGFLDTIKWSLGILKFKSDSIQWEKATQIIERVLGLFQQRQVLQILSL